jgi:SAM-dependent methyltransferase
MVAPVRSGEDMTWQDEWSKAHDRSPLNVTAENESRWKRYWNACAEQYGRDVDAEAHLYQAVVDHLLREGRLCPTDSVLDVGCGPGTYTIPMAQHALCVMGLDPAEGMIHELSGRADEKRLTNVEGTVARWDEFGIGGFDLVVSALSPAASNSEGLMKMGSTSKRDCCYIAPARGKEMNARNDLWERVVGEFRPSFAYDIKYPFNILIEAGERPDLKHISASVETEVDADVAISNFQTYFEIFTEMDDEKRAVIRDFVLDRSEYGIFRKKAKKVLAVMTWSPAHGSRA